MSNCSVVHIKRLKRYYFSLCKIDIYLDGQKLAALANGKSISLEIAPGLHTLYCQSGKYPSETLEWESIEGKHLQLECEFVDWPMHHFYWSSAISLGLVLIYAYGFWGLHWLYSREMCQAFVFLGFFIQSAGFMWSFYLQDKQWGKQIVRLWLDSTSQTVGQLLPSPAKEQHDHLLFFISMPFVMAAFIAIFFDFYFYVVLPAIFP